MKWGLSALLTDSYPVQPDDKDHVYISLSRVPYLEHWKYVEATQRIVWTLMETTPANAACQHLCVKRHVLDTISTHKPQDWK